MKPQQPAWLEAFAESSPETLPPGVLEEPPLSAVPVSPAALERPRDSDAPLVSVIIPTYRDASYLGDALHTVAAQTYPTVEAILVDSADNSWLRELARECSWLRYLPTEPEGPGAARNVGIEAAHGEYIAFLDGDDLWHPLKLERQVEAIQSGTRTSLCAHYFVKFRDNARPEIKLRGGNLCRPEDAARLTVQETLYPHVSAILATPDVLPSPAFQEWLDNFEDIVFAAELFSDAPPAQVTEPLAIRRFRAGSLTDRTAADTQFNDRIAGLRYLARSNPSLAETVDRKIRDDRLKRGVKSLANGERAEARRQFHHLLGDGDARLIAAFGTLASLVPGGGPLLVRLMLALDRHDDGRTSAGGNGLSDQFTQNGRSPHE